MKYCRLPYLSYALCRPTFKNEFQYFDWAQSSRFQGKVKSALHDLAKYGT